MVYKIKDKCIVHPIDQDLDARIDIIHTSIDAINLEIITNENDFISSSIEEQVLAAYDLTTIHNEIFSYLNLNKQIIFLSKIIFHRYEYLLIALV
jgi:hypothetical protein